MQKLSHWQEVKRILRYLKETSRFGLILRQPSSFSVQAFADAGWASDPDERHSTSSLCVFFGGNLITWGSKKQHTVSRSSTEAEF